jgi:cell division protein FtsI (penicillin-binding protein 3)
VPGATLELTLDMGLQHIAERELKAGVEANNAAGGTAIIMAPATGEVLALASYPDFNPNAVGKSSLDQRRNRATQDVYEPGSTFKIVTASAAIEEGIVSPNDLIDCNPGRITFPGRKPITEAKGHNYGLISFEDVIVKSSNIGAIKVGLRTGVEKMSKYVHRFGFGQSPTTGTLLAPAAASGRRTCSTTAVSPRCLWVIRWP